MTSVDRARQFLQKKARALAIAAAPLATLVMLSTPVQATVTSFNAPSCSGAGGVSFSGTCSGGLTPTQTNGVNGMTLFGDITASNINSGGGISMVWTGTTNGGSFGGLLPVDWDFSVDPSNSGSSYDWSVTFNFGGGVPLVESGFGSGSMNFTGVDLLGISASSYSVTLSIEQTTAVPDQLELLVPVGATIDINPAPEPASVFLVAPGLGLLLLRRRRKKT